MKRASLLDQANGDAVSPIDVETRKNIHALASSLKWFFEHGIEITVKPSPKSYTIEAKRAD